MKDDDIIHNLRILLEKIDYGDISSHEIAWFTSLKKDVRSRLAPTPKPGPGLLELISTVVIPATTLPFIAKEKFVLNNIDDEAKVRFVEISERFSDYFLIGEGKIEDPIKETRIRFSRLLDFSVGGPIITALGGRDLAMTGLTHIYSLLENKDLSDRDCSVPPWMYGYNIFFVPQKVSKIIGQWFSYVNRAGQTVEEEANHGQLFEVGCQWYVLREVMVRSRSNIQGNHYGWEIDAGSSPVSGVAEWCLSDCVFSHDPVINP